MGALFWKSKKTCLSMGTGSAFKRIRRASAQWRVRSWTLSFDISPFIFSNCFRNFCNRSQLNFELFSKVLQSKPTQAAIFEQFFDFELQSTQTWTQIRTTIRARGEIEQEFELELLFLFEKCAREAVAFIKE